MTPRLLEAGESLRVRWLGRLPYAEAWDLQKAIWEGRTLGRTNDDYLLLVEHPHTYTVGRNGDGSNLVVSDDMLASLGAEMGDVAEVDQDAVPEPPDEATTRPGDLWVLGRHRLLCGGGRAECRTTTGGRTG